MNRELHLFQTAAIDRLRQSLASGHRRPLLQLPTGAGKTIIAAHIVEKALGKGKRAMIAVPLLTLVDQTVERFAEEGIHAVGVMQAYHPLTNCEMPVQVASVQTLARRAVPQVDLVLVDEAHKQFDFVTHWLGSPGMAQIPAIGLSATPWARGLGKTYDDLVVGARIRELIDAGFLSDYRVFAPSHPDLTGVRTVGGDYHEGELSEVMQAPALVADVVATWKRLAENRSTLVFAVDRAHAHQLQREFEAAGIAVAYIDAFTESSERKAIFAQLHDGAIRAIVSIATLTTGVDLDVRCIVLARPTKSEMLYVQIAGRGLRVSAPRAAAVDPRGRGRALRKGVGSIPRHIRATAPLASRQHLGSTRARCACPVSATSEKYLAKARAASRVDAQALARWPTWLFVGAGRDSRLPRRNAR